MSRFSSVVIVLAAAGWVPCLALAAAPKSAPVDGETLNRLADAEFNHGEVVETIEYLADHIGGRMTNSPSMRAAEIWGLEKFTRSGLANIHKEGFEFGRGWWIETAHVRMVTPRPLELRAIPVAWTPPTNGVLTAPIIVAPIKAEKDLAEWHGKLAGKIVLTSWPAPPSDETEPAFKRLSDADLKKLDEYEEPKFDPEAEQRVIDRYVLLPRKIDAFLAAEGALASVHMSRAENHLVHGEGYAFQVGLTPKLPSIDLAAEDYRRLARLAKTGDVRLPRSARLHEPRTSHQRRHLRSPACRGLAPGGRRARGRAAGRSQRRGAAAAQAGTDRAAAHRSVPLQGSGESLRSVVYRGASNPCSARIF